MYQNRIGKEKALMGQRPAYCFEEETRHLEENYHGKVDQMSEIWNRFTKLERIKEK